MKAFINVLVVFFILLTLPSALLNAQEDVQEDNAHKGMKKIGEDVVEGSFFINFAQKPSIQWLNPTISPLFLSSTEPTKNMIIEACIESTIELTHTDLLLNGKSLKTRGFSVVEAEETGTAEACTYRFIETVTLEKGRNTLTLKASNQIGETTVTRIITYEVKPKKAPEKRLALLIGNSNYSSWSRLSNPSNDVDTMANKLFEVGFHVIKVTNLTKRQLVDTIRFFAQERQNYDVGLAYYSGHGVQIDGINYMVPIESPRICDNADAQQECVSIDFLTEKMEGKNDKTNPMEVNNKSNFMEGANGKANFVVIDACRNGNSCHRGSETTTPIDTKGSLVAFSTAPGQVAYDGKQNGNSPYVNAWKKYLKKGSNILYMLTDINAYVKAETKGKQIPFFHSGLGKNFIF